MTNDPLLTTLEKIVSLHEGVAESVNPHTLSVLLTEDVAKTLALSEEVTFTTRADVPNSHFVSYNSDILKKFESLLDRKGCVSALGVRFDGYLKTTGFEKVVMGCIRPSNGLLRFLEAKPATTRYILCNVAYIAEADENRLGMVSFFINERTGVAPVEIGDALLWKSDWTAVDDSSLPPSQPTEFLLSLIEKKAEGLIARDLETWRNRLARKRQRDEERLKGYYGTIEQEINLKIYKKKLEGEDKERELDRIAATQLELERKLADVRKRYSINLKAQLHSALVLHLPTIHIQCELTRKRSKQTVTAVWNPFTKLLEPLRCELSAEPVFNFYLDDEARIISPSCWREK
jgi:hypothetical protein